MLSAFKDGVRGYGEMAQPLQGLAALSEDPSLVPSTLTGQLTAAWNSVPRDMLPFPGLSETRTHMAFIHTGTHIHSYKQNL